MFAIEYNGYVWKSADFGETWVSLKGIGTDNWSSISCQYKNTGNIVVGLTLEEGGIYISIDSGTTWLYKLNDTPPTKKCAEWKTFKHSVNINLKVIPSDNLRVFIWNKNKEVFGIDNFKVKIYNYS